MHKPYFKNEPGDFYVEDGCCITCGVPLEVAPQFLAFFDEPAGGAHCYVHCQPRTPDDRDTMIKAMKSGEVECIRYQGTDQLFREKLVAHGLADQIDDEGSSPTDIPT